MPAKHSLFGASSAARFIACPGAWREGQKAEKAGLTPRRSKTSVYAEEGTAAHALAEICLAAGKPPHDYVDISIQLKSSGSRFKVDFDFAEAVGVYYDLIDHLKSLGCEIWLEKTVEPAWAWTGDTHQTQDASLPFDLFGTADCVAYLPETGHLFVVDLKFGRGVLVEVANNPQLKYYAVGAMRELLAKGRPIKQVTTTIVQPRMAHPDGPVRSTEYHRLELINWARGELKPAIDLALTPDAPLSAGSHCRFCPAILSCEEAKKKVQKSCADLFEQTPIEGLDAFLKSTLEKARDPKLLGGTPLTKLDELYGHAQVAKMVIAQIEETLLEALPQATAEERDNLKHVKMVQTPSRECWQTTPSYDEAGTMALILNKLTRQKVPASEIVKPVSLERQLITPKQARRVLKKHGMPTNELDPFTTTTAGRGTLAPKDDPRPEFLPDPSDTDPDAGGDLLG
jgi:hypothetical protein